MGVLKLSEIIGQEKAKSLMLQAVEQNKLGHAYLLRGPMGVGKKTFARSYAAFLNCQQRSADDFCGVCPSCRQFLSGNHPDFLSIQPQGAGIKIDQIRELKKKLTFPPFGPGIRVILLPDIHHNLQRKEVANSLLKTLEEPPADTILLLSADASGSVLSTILSRCQTIHFHPLPLSMVAEGLTKAQNMSQEQAYALGAFCEGSMGKAAMLADKNLLPLRLELVENILDLDKSRPEAIERLFSLAEKASELKENLIDFFELLQLWIRDLLLLKTQVETTLLLNHDLRHTYVSVTDRWSLAELFAKLRHIDKARKQLRHNCNRLSVCEMLFWELL